MRSFMNQESRSEGLQSIYPQYINTYDQQDEISLVDLWIALLKFKKVFVTSFVGMLIIGGLILGATLETKHNLTSVISIGQLTIIGGYKPLESPEAVIGRVSVILAPALTKMIAKNNGMDIFITNISNPKGTDLIVVENKVVDSSRAAIAQFQKQLLSAIIASHDTLSEIGDGELREKLSLEKLKLSELTNPLELSKLTREKVIELQLSKLELFELSDDAYLNQKKAGYLTDIQFRADNIQVYIKQNRELKGLAKTLGSNDESSYERSKIEIEILENSKKINQLLSEKTPLELELAVFELQAEPKRANQQVVVKAIQLEIDLIGITLANQIEQQKLVVEVVEKQLGGSQTKAIAVAELSLNPIGLGMIAKVAIVVFLSFIVSFLVTLTAMFGRKVNEKLAEEA
ncbi:MAG: hypothetical protein ACI9OI_002098 [Chitinophagales bacterium]|jgi:hypothetical protein